MNKYLYDGPVLEFEKCITNRWTASTYAASEKKALSNLNFQFKKNNNKSVNSKITLPGKLISV